MRKALAGFVAGLLLASAFIAGASYAQSGSVNFLGSIAGTTNAANCGTPVTPSLCVVGNGVWIWQSAATGWFLPTPPVPATGGVKTVQGIAPGANGDVDLKCQVVFPSMQATFSGGVSTSASISTQTLPVPCVGVGN